MLPNLFFFICVLTSSFIFTTHSYNNKCLLHQEILLLQLRDELIFDSSLSTKLVRWNESDECCKWRGVECDASGYVLSLQLDDEAISGGVGDSSSLFRFEYLQKLNLAYNDFDYTDHIPKGIGNLTYLTHLNLSNAGFVGQVPAEISSLKRLVSLDISDYNCWTHGEFLSLEYPNLEMLVRNLTGLRVLYLDCVNITSFHEREKWSHIVSSHLPNLTALSLNRCSLSGPLARSFWKLHSLSILRLDDANLSTVAVPDFFINFSSLNVLSLYNCSLKGSIPSTFANLTKLIHVDLSYNDLTGSFPPTLFANLTKLSHVDFSFNDMTGSLPSTLFANLTKLSHVALSYNSLTGSLPSTLFEGLSNLVNLDLYKNSFLGNIPQSLFALPSLLELDLSYNQFNDTFQLDNFRSLPNLTLLDLSGNSLSVDVGNVNSSSNGGLQLKQLYLASCNLSHFPDFIKDLDLYILDLSANSIAGEIPSWIWGTQLMALELSFNLLTDFQKPYHIPASLEDLLLDSNQLRGELQLPIPLESELIYLSFVNNSLSGSIPTSLCNATHLDYLTLSGNKLSGSIPPCLLENIKGLGLNQNNINGSIPDHFPSGCRLEMLLLNNNTMEGKIPKSLEHCKWLTTMDVGNNNINDTFPCMLSSSLSVLVLHSNRFHGEVACNMNCHTEPSPREHEDVEEKTEIEWEYVSAALGYVVGFGSIVWLLLFCRSFRHKYFGKIDEIIEEVLDRRDRRRRRARMAARNRARRQQ
ncbi:receptor-like protein 31 [Salvia divinorum]|uniref:Receptor-like protein 31 n=1 Tax=Salvia divinorum TaxID=28513 RepID=A0ABD1GES5_SALDI